MVSLDCTSWKSNAYSVKDLYDMIYLTQSAGMPRRPPIQHDELSLPLTLARKTDIKMPMLDEETTLTALFVLDDDVPVDVRS
jgi:hypothetical protein